MRTSKLITAPWERLAVADLKGRQIKRKKGVVTFSVFTTLPRRFPHW